jgi:hypothetical protein
MTAIAAITTAITTVQPAFPRAGFHASQTPQLFAALRLLQSISLTSLP